MRNSALYNAVKAGFSIYKTPPPLTLNEDANNSFVIVKGETKIGDWESLSYQIAPLNWMGNFDIKILDWKKSSRVGATKCACAAWAYFTKKNLDQLIYQPTVDDAAKFKKDEINGLLLHIKSLYDICKENPEKRSSAFTTDRLTFIGSTSDILGGKTPRNFRRMTKDVVIYDELSGFDQDIGGEGSALKLGDMRLAVSPFKKSIRLSTPKIKGTCQISATFNRADVRMYRWLPCPQCGEYQILEWRDKETKEYRFDIESSSYICKHNGCVITYDNLPEMDRKGQWRSYSGSIVYNEREDQFYQDGEKTPFPNHVGMHIWAAYSRYQTWEELINEWVAANKELKETGDTTILKSFVNIQLGEEWEDRGEKADIDFNAEDRLEEISEKLPVGVLFLTMGVDVQSGKDSRLEYEVVGWGDSEESWSIDYGVINGDPDIPHVWDNLDEVRKRIYEREDGVKIKVSCCCVDSGHKPDAVYGYTTPRQIQRVFATKGYSEPGKPIESGYSYPKRKNKKSKTRLYMVGTDTAKELLYSRLNKIKEPGPGYCHFPDHYDDEYFAQLTSEEKRTVRDKKTGRKKFKWVKTRERNEALDCRVLNIVALRILNPNFAAVKRRLIRSRKEQEHTEQVEEQEHTEQVEEANSAPRKRRPIRRKKTGWFGNG